MRIALGSDHRGAQIAYIIANALLRNALLRKASDDSNDERVPKLLLGANLIVDATVADLSPQAENSKNQSENTTKMNDEQNVPLKNPTIRPIFYRCATQNDAESSAAPNESLNADENAPTSIDYPDVAAAVAQAVSRGEADRGILICGTGIGMSIAANKFRGVRAAVCYNEVAAELSRRHNDANVLCLSGEFLGEQAAKNLAGIWLNAPYDGGRHARRVAKISQIEEETGL